jgi:L-fucose mutarotase
MQVVGDATTIPQPVKEFGEVFARHGRAAIDFGKLEREAFYARARNAYAVVRTGDLRPYGNILLVKGVVNAYPPTD